MSGHQAVWYVNWTIVQKPHHVGSIFLVLKNVTWRMPRKAVPVKKTSWRDWHCGDFLTTTSYTKHGVVLCKWTLSLWQHDNDPRCKVKGGVCTKMAAWITHSRIVMANAIPFMSTWTRTPVGTSQTTSQLTINDAKWDAWILGAYNTVPILSDHWWRVDDVIRESSTVWGVY